MSYENPRPGTEAPVYVVCPKCGYQVLVARGDVDARCSSCKAWVRR